jgi:uncharacterized protein (TIRG00374 family)
MVAKSVFVAKSAFVMATVDPTAARLAAPQRRIAGGSDGRVRHAATDMRRTAHLSVGLVVSVLCGWLALRSVDLHAVVRGIRQADLTDLAVALLLVVVAFVIRGFRWQAMFAEGVSTSTAMWTTLVGLFLNVALPVRAGEVGRALAMKRAAAIPVVEALTATVVERVYDVVALAVLLLLTLQELPSTVLVRTLAVASVALVALGALVALAAGRFLDRIQRLAARAVRRILAGDVRVSRAGASIRAGLHAARRRRAAVQVFVLSVVSWVVLAAANWAVLRAVHVSVPWSASVLVLVATNLAAILPSTAASLGVFEAAARVALTAYGVSATAGATAAIVVHAVNLAPAIVLGAVGVVRLGLSWRELRHAGDAPGRLAVEPESATMQP